jgi:hypothetical protein
MLTGWLPDATIWLRDVVAGQRCLGQWQGGPHGAGVWGAPHGAFAVAGEDRNGASPARSAAQVVSRSRSTRRRIFPVADRGISGMACRARSFL